jgi:hypothetical protein
MTYVERIIENAKDLGYTFEYSVSEKCESREDFLDAEKEFPTLIKLTTSNSVRLDLRAFEWSRTCMLAVAFLRSNDEVFKIESHTQFLNLTLTSMAGFHGGKLVEILDATDTSKLTTSALLNYIKLKGEKEKLMSWIEDV